MRFGCTVVFVKDVPVTVAFYEKAFGLKRRLMREDLGYAELGTGSTALAFKNHSSEPPPAGFEITLYTPDVDSVFDRAVTAGAEALLKPEMKSWGQKVARVRDCNGVQVEIATPLQ